MAFKVIGITEKVIEKGENKGKPYFIVEFKQSSMYNTKVSRAALFPEADVEIERYRTAIAEGKFEPINARRYMVGDTSVNPNEKPLPTFKLRDREGKLMDTEYNSMAVTCILDDDGIPLMSPRNIALRIIDTRGEYVTSVASNAGDLADDLPA